MLVLATTSTAEVVLPLRVRYREEMNGQIVHDSIHRREGWTVTYMLSVDGITAGFGSIALAGPWKDKLALQSKDGTRMLAWINNAASSVHVSLARFAQGLRRDLKPVMAAVESDWSSGQVEGQVNRLKALKRQMYGRAGFTLLRARVLPLSPSAP